MTRFKEFLPVGDVREATQTSEIESCWPAFKELRPHLDSRLDLVERWDTQKHEGYRVIYLEKGGIFVAVGGFRILTTLAWGKILYIDDLVVLESYRGSGLGATLLDWLKNEAKNLACTSVHLDTGFQRRSAHKTYIRNDFQLDCHHLAYNLLDP